jgi:hypothetical protein
MKRICLLSYLFPPVLSAESMALLKKVRVLAERFALTIVTAKNENGVYPSDPALEKYIPPNVEVIRVAATSRPNRLHRLAHTTGRILFRGSTTVQYYDLLWARNAALAVRRQIEKGRTFDLLMTNAQHMCSHVAGYWVRPSLPVPWIQHYSDPIQHSAARGSFLPAQKLDDWFVPRLQPEASLITVPSEEMKQCLYDAYDAETRRKLLLRTIVVPHTYDEEFMRDGLNLYPVRERFYGDSGPIHVCYAGNLYGIRSAELVANAARRLSSGDTTKEFIVHVFGAVRGKDRRQLDQMGAYVRFHGNVSYLESLAVMQHADILLLLDVPLPASPFFPSKLAEYLGTRRPIVVVAAPDSAAARIASEMGLILRPYSEDPIRIQNDSHGGQIERRQFFSNRAENYRELIDEIDRLS